MSSGKPKSSPSDFTSGHNRISGCNTFEGKGLHSETVKLPLTVAGICADAADVLRLLYGINPCRGQLFPLQKLRDSKSAKIGRG